MSTARSDEASATGAKARQYPVRSTALKWLVAGVMFVGVIVLSLGPDPIPDVGPAPVDRLPHVIGYMALTASLLVARSRARRGISGATRGDALIAMAIVGLGAILEGGQAAVHRDADLWDVLADGIGVAIGASLALIPKRGWSPW